MRFFVQQMRHIEPRLIFRSVAVSSSVARRFPIAAHSVSATDFVFTTWCAWTGGHFRTSYSSAHKLAALTDMHCRTEPSFLDIVSPTASRFTSADVCKEAAIFTLLLWCHVACWQHSAGLKTFLMSHVTMLSTYMTMRRCLQFLSQCEGFAWSSPAKPDFWLSVNELILSRQTAATYSSPFCAFLGASFAFSSSVTWPTRLYLWTLF